MPTRASLPCPVPGCAELKPCPAHPTKPWANSNQRRRAMGQASGWAEQRAAQKVRRRDKHTCQQCGALVARDQGAVDHRTPLATSHDNSTGNKQLLCGPCHQAKTEAERHARQAQGRGTTRGR